ncbi:hypothetical protein F4819DRAFT_7066 [Hypoxylon fuscum]|nr:hypothetical protein F4819DRAFT_7066 [Hypoxylon fuscum]
MKIHSFQEARGISGVKGFHGKVVDEFSSKVDLPSHETAESIDADHMQMARCSKKADQQYRVISQVLRQFIHGRSIDDHETGAREFILTNREAALGKGKELQSAASGPYYCIPLHRNDRFTGRNALLDQLKEAFFIKKESQKLAVVGLGGVGKTQAALQFAYWVQDNQPDYSVFWVPAQSDGSFEQAYTEIARQFDIRSDKNNEDSKEMVQCYLNSKAAGKWLLIIDNADDADLFFGPSDKPGGMNRYLPESNDGLILFTTRSRDVAIAAAGSDVIDLHEMNPEEATSFLEKALIRKQILQNKTMLEELLQELTYLPLAIAQAAAYINRNQISVEKYLGLLQGTEQNMVGLLSREFHDGTRYPGSQNAIATTWLVSFEQIQKSDSTAADLLSFVSCIEPKAIPQSLLPNQGSDEEMENAIGTLCGYAFLVRRGDDEVFDMHSLVHVATRVWIHKHNRTQEVTVRVLGRLEAIFPSEDRENRNLWREYLPHALRVLEGSEECQVEERYKLFYRVGRCLNADRRFKEAVRVFEEAYAWKRRHASQDTRSQLKLEHCLASAYIDDRRIKEAIEILEHVVAIQNKTLAEEDKNRLDSEHELARAYLEDRRIKEAIEIFEHVVTIRKKTLEEEDHDRLISEHELASAYLNDERIKEAIEIFEHTVAIRKKILAKEDHSRLTSEHELARAYLQNNRVSEAIIILEHVTAVDAKILTEEDRDRLASEHALGRAYLDNGQVSEAIVMLEHVVSIRKTLAEEDCNRLASEHLLAEAYLQNNRVSEAIIILEHVTSIRKKTLSETDDNRLSSEYKLGRAYLDNGQVSEAIIMLEHVTAVDAKILDVDDDDRIASQELLMKAYTML